MPLRRPTPKQISQEELTTMLNASATAVAGNSVPKVWDKNFNFFDTPTNGGQYLIYVNGFFRTDDNGKQVFSEDTFFAHSIKDGRTNLRVRCHKDMINPSYGLDGTCPFCDAMATSWELYNYEYNNLCRKKGLDPNDKGTYDIVKDSAKSLKENMAVSGKASQRHTFAITVIETEKASDGQMTLAPAKDAEGHFKATPYYFTVSDYKFVETWKPALENGLRSNAIMTGSESFAENPSIGGRFFILGYDIKNESDPTKLADKMTLANKYNVTYTQLSVAEQLGYTAEVRAWFDSLASEYTRENAAIALVENSWRSMNELQTYCNEVMQNTVTRLAVINSSAGVTATPVASSAEQALQNFGAVTPQAIGVGTADTPQGTPVNAIPTATPQVTPVATPIVTPQATPVNTPPQVQIGV